MSIERLKRLFGLREMPFWPDARAVNLPPEAVVIPRSLSDFFGTLHGTAAYGRPSVFLVEARIGAGKTTVFNSIISSINENRLTKFVEQNEMSLEKPVLRDFEKSKGFAFRVELSTELLEDFNEYAARIYTNLSLRLRGTQFSDLKRKKDQEIAEIVREADRESKILYPLVETLYLLLDKSEGLGYDYLLMVLDEFDTILTHDPKKVDVFLDLIIRKFHDKIKMQPSWTRASPAICVALLCAHYNIDKVKALIEKSAGAVARTFYLGPRIGYSSDEFSKIVERRLAYYRDRDFRVPRGNEYYPFSKQILNQLYEAYYDKGTNMLNNVGIAEQTLYAVLRSWDLSGRIEETTALQEIQRMKRDYVRTETTDDLAVEVETSRFFESKDPKERISKILDGFVQTARKYEMEPFSDKLMVWISQPIGEADKWIWYARPFDFQYQNKSRTVYLVLTEFGGEKDPGDAEISRFLNEIKDKFEENQLRLPAPQGMLILYRAPVNKDKMFREKFEKVLGRHLNVVEPIFLDRDLTINLIKVAVAQEKQNETTLLSATQRLAAFATQRVQNFVRNINDLVPSRQKIENESVRIYAALLAADRVEHSRDLEIVSGVCAAIYKDALRDMHIRYTPKTVQKTLSSLETDGFVFKDAGGNYRPTTPFSISYFLDFVREGGANSNVDTLEKVFGRRLDVIRGLLDSEYHVPGNTTYDLMTVKGENVELLSISDARVQFRNSRGRVDDVRNEILESKKAAIPLLALADSLRTAADATEDDFQTVLLQKLAVEVLERGILDSFRLMDDRMAELRKKKDLPKAILEDKLSKVWKAKERILLDASFDDADKIMAEIDEFLRPVTKRPLIGKKPVIEITTVPRRETAYKEWSSATPVLDDARIRSILARPRTLSELSAAFGVSNRDTVLTKIEPMILQDQLVLQCKGSRKEKGKGTMRKKESRKRIR